MIDIEREETILKLLKENKTMRIEELARLLYVSSATLRRDLTKMERKGLVIRTFGAVMLLANHSDNESAFKLRENANINEKRYLCQKVSEYIKNNTIIFLDSSTTVLNIVPYLNNYQNLTIITNGLFLAQEIIMKTKHKVFVPGGYIAPYTNSILGPLTIDFLHNFHADMAIISSSSISIDEFGLSETSIEQAEIKKIMIRNSTVNFCLADKTKFNKKDMYQSSSLRNIDNLITTCNLKDEQIAYLKSVNTDCIIIK